MESLKLEMLEITKRLLDAQVNSMIKHSAPEMAIAIQKDVAEETEKIIQEIKNDIKKEENALYLRHCSLPKKDKKATKKGDKK